MSDYDKIKALRLQIKTDNEQFMTLCTKHHDEEDKVKEKSTNLL